MNKLMLDTQTLQMRNQQELFSLLQSRLERVSCGVGAHYNCTMFCRIPQSMLHFRLYDSFH